MLRKAVEGCGFDQETMRATKMKKSPDPSNPVNLDSGQRKELTYLIESLRKDISRPKKEGTAGTDPSKETDRPRYSSSFRRNGESFEHTGIFGRNLLEAATGISA